MRLALVLRLPPILPYSPPGLVGTKEPSGDHHCLDCCRYTMSHLTSPNAHFVRLLLSATPLPIHNETASDGGTQCARNAAAYLLCRYHTPSDRHLLDFDGVRHAYLWTPTYTNRSSDLRQLLQPSNLGPCCNHADGLAIDGYNYP